MNFTFNIEVNKTIKKIKEEQAEPQNKPDNNDTSTPPSSENKEVPTVAVNSNFNATVKNDSEKSAQNGTENNMSSGIKGEVQSEMDISGPISFAEDSRLTTKDAYNSYWRCRDFELTHLWQRSVFLATFLLFFCSAYGVLVAKMLDKLPKEFSGLSCSPFWIVSNSTAVLISTIIIILACFWIMTAKSSKLWYEVYENAIDAYTKDTNHINKNDGDAEKILGFQFGMLKNYEKPFRTDELKTSDGGAYSVSRINWAIGYMFLWIGGILLVVHSSFLGGIAGETLNETSGKCLGGVVGFVIGVTGSFLIPHGIQVCKKLKSSFLSDFINSSSNKKK